VYIHLEEREREPQKKKNESALETFETIEKSERQLYERSLGESEADITVRRSQNEADNSEKEEVDAKDAAKNQTHSRCEIDVPQRDS